MIKIQEAGQVLYKKLILEYFIFNKTVQPNVD